MQQIDSLANYVDSRGNEIVYGGSAEPTVNIRFQDGSRNRVVIDPEANLRNITVDFRGDDGLVEIARTTRRRAGIRFNIRVGHGSSVRVGEDVGSAGMTFISATEGADVTIGDDVMFASNVEVRTDDTHAIYDVHTGARKNVSESIVIGAHVWVAKHVVVMGGVSIGDGSVIGFRSVVTSSVPNNCVAVGAPARIVDRDVAWERPETPNRPPEVIWPLPHQKSEQYWNVTSDSAASAAPSVTPPRIAGRDVPHQAPHGEANVAAPRAAGDELN